MRAQPKAPADLRCKRHGLAALGLGLAVASGAVTWRLLHEKARAAAPEDVGSVTAQDEPVRLAPGVDRQRPQTVARAIPLAVAAEPENSGTAEDLRLGQATVRPKEIAVAPPTPPRASVDPEPRALDDPADFELPAR